MNEQTDDEKTRLVANERSKLTATFMNGVAVAMVAIGGLAPVLTPFLAERPYALRDIAAIFTTFAFALHAGARRLLGALEP